MVILFQLKVRKAMSVHVVASLAKDFGIDVMKVEDASSGFSVTVGEGIFEVGREMAQYELKHLESFRFLITMEICADEQRDNLITLEDLTVMLSVDRHSDQ